MKNRTALPDPSHGFMPYPTVSVAHAASGPLAGLRFAVKDLFDVAGYPTSAGQPLWLALSGIREHSARVVQQCLDQGAEFAGKSITDELAFSINGNNAHFGAPINAAAPDRITGGSSSGSAAVVAHGLVDFAIGTDTGGSVRVPAHHCGLFGLRPTHGRISLAGCHDLSPSFDACGWFAKDLPTFARVGAVLLDHDESTRPLCRLIVPDDVWGLPTAGLRETLLPLLDRAQSLLGSPVRGNAVPGGFDHLVGTFRKIQGFEAWRSNGEFITRFNPPLGPGVRERFAWASTITASDYAQALTDRQQLAAELDQLLGEDGVMIIPTMPDVAPLRTQAESELENYRSDAQRMLSIAGIGGLPQLHLPWAHHLEAPTGLSLVGPRGSDRRLIELAGYLS
jgi:amidase